MKCHLNPFPYHKTMDMKIVGPLHTYFVTSNRLKKSIVAGHTDNSTVASSYILLLYTSNHFARLDFP